MHQLTIEDLHTDIVSEIVKYFNLLDLLACKSAISKWNDSIERQLKKYCRVFKITPNTKSKYQYTAMRRSVFQQYSYMLDEVSQFIEYLTIDYSIVSKTTQLNRKLAEKCVLLQHLQIRKRPPTLEERTALAMNALFAQYEGDDLIAAATRLFANGFDQQTPADNDDWVLEQLEPVFPQLKSITVTEMKTTGSFLNKLPGLKSLSLQGVISLNPDILNSYLTINSNLKHFELQTEDYIDVAKIVPHLLNVVQLKICVYSMHPQNITTIANLEHLSHLDINLNDKYGLNKILTTMKSNHSLKHIGIYLYGTLSTEAYASLSKMPNLKSVSIATVPCCFGDIHIEISKLNDLAPTLTHLEILSSSFNLRDLCSQFVNLEYLKLSVDINEATVSDIDLVSIAMLKKLRSLNLTVQMARSLLSTRTTFNGLIEALAETNVLDCLVLHNNELNNCLSVKELDSLEKLTKLKKFDVTYPIHLERLLKMNWIKTVEYLDVSCASRNHLNTSLLEDIVRETKRLRSFSIRLVSSCDADLRQKLADICYGLEVSITCG